MTPEKREHLHLAAPRVPGSLSVVSDLVAWITHENEGDPRVVHLDVSSDASQGVDLSFLDLSESRMVGCSYLGCDFSRATFDDVSFERCDFSNCDFSEANFNRCSFAACKLTGADFGESVLRHVAVRDSTLTYAAFTEARIDTMEVHASDFSHVDLSGVRLRRFHVDDVRFVGTSFFRTRSCPKSWCKSVF